MENAGDPTVVWSSGSAYVHVTAQFEHLYNLPPADDPNNNLNDVLHASRTLVWIKPDYIVCFDRAITTKQHFKRFYLNFAKPPGRTGQTVSATTPHGQNFYVTVLLPSGPTANITLTNAFSFNDVADQVCRAFVHGNIRLECCLCVRPIFGQVEA